jgi:hypothetical protein
MPNSNRIRIKERLAEERAKRELRSNSNLPEATRLKLEELADKKLGTLIKLCDEDNIIKIEMIEELFQDLKFKNHCGRRILDKAGVLCNPDPCCEDLVCS